MASAKGHRLAMTVSANMKGAKHHGVTRHDKWQPNEKPGGWMVGDIIKIKLNYSSSCGVL
jgi:hypothetical protein